MTSDEDEFTDAFESVAPAALGPAMAYVQDLPDVSDVWIYASFEDKVMATSTVYKVGGKFLPLSDDVYRAFPQLGSPDDVIDEISDAFDPIFFEVPVDSRPNSMVIHYHAPTEEMKAQFSYERVPLRDQESYSGYAERWAQEFRG